MVLTRIILTLRAMGLAYIIPIAVGFDLCAAMFGATIHFYGFVSVPSLIALAAALGFLSLLVLPFAIFHSRYYSRIDGSISFGNSVVVYLMSGELLGPDGSDAVFAVIESCLRLASDALGSVGFFPPAEVLRSALADLVICFVADIDETAYYHRWGVKYSRIAGLYCGDHIVVVKSLVQPLEETALAHELLHVIIDARSEELRRYGKLEAVEDTLGLEH
jgi:hypothetical protein